MPILQAAGGPKIIRRRNTGPALPGDVTGLKLWLDLSDASTMYQDTAGTTPVTADGQSIARLVSKVGTTALTQGTAGARPTYKTNIVNGRSVARFDGGAVIVETSFVIDPRSRTVFVIAQENSEKNNAGILLLRPATGTDYGRSDAALYETGGALYTFAIEGGGYTPKKSGTGPTPLAIYCDCLSPTSGSLYVNGGTAAATDTAFTFAAATGGGVSLGGRFSNGDSPSLIGDICEILIYTSQLSVADTNKVGAYLATKWGLTWSNIS